MKAIGLEVRQRAVAAYRRGEGTMQRLAVIFDVSVSWFSCMVRRTERCGAVPVPDHPGGSEPLLTAADDRVLEDLVAQQPDATLAELRERLRDATGTAVSAATVCRACQRLKLGRKKKRSLPPSGTVPTSGRPVRTLPNTGRGRWISSTSSPSMKPGRPHP